MSAEKSGKKKKKKKKSDQTLAYPIPIRGEKAQLISQTLQYLYPKENEYLSACYEQETLEQLASSNRKAYKVLEPETIHEKKTGLSIPPCG